MKDLTPLEHVFCSFLALVLRKALDDRLAARQWRLESDHIVQDLVTYRTRTVKSRQYENETWSGLSKENCR